MAEPSNVEIKSCFKWSTILPSVSIVSPAFEVQGLECLLEITKVNADFMLVFDDCCYSVEVKRSGKPIPSRCFFLMATVQCDETILTFYSDSYNTVKMFSLEKCHLLIGKPDARVAFIIHFDSDVHHKEEISEADKKRAQLASDSFTQTLCLKALSHDFSKLLEDSSSHDVVLICQDRTIKAHKIVLMSRSKVFEGMLRSDMVEGLTGQVEVKDMDAEVFLILVKYLYTGTLTKLSVDRAKRLYEAGDRYAVESLMQRCSGFLIENLTNENACDILEVAETHYDSVFKEMVIGYILKNKIPLMDQVWKPFSTRWPLVAVDVLNRFIKLQATT